METERLVVRNFRVSDWEALHEMIVQYQSSEYAAYDHPWPTSPEEIQGVTEWFASGDSYLAVCLKDNGRFIGFVALNPREGEDCQRYGLGYVFHPDCHGQGYATEACRAVLGHAFDGLQAQRVVSDTAAANRPSCRLLERLGFQKTGESMGSFRNAPDGEPIEFLAFSYALTREAWEVAGQ